MSPHILEIIYEDMSPGYKGCECAGFSPLFAWIEGEVVHSAVVLCPNVIKAPVVPESPPLHVDTHLSLVSLDHLDVPHLLHVTCVTAGAYNHTNMLDGKRAENWLKKTVSVQETNRR